MKQILTAIITITALTLTSIILANDYDSEFVETFVRKCMNEYDMSVIKKYKGDDENTEKVLEMNKMMAPMVQQSIEGWVEMKQKWEDAKLNGDYEIMKNAAEYCNNTRTINMDICPKLAKTLPILKAE